MAPIVGMLAGMVIRGGVAAAARGIIGTGARAAGRGAFAALKRRAKRRMLRRLRRGQTISQFTRKRFRADAPSGVDPVRRQKFRIQKLQNNTQGGGGGGQGQNLNNDDGPMTLSQKLRLAAASVVAFTASIPAAIKGLQLFASALVDRQSGTAKFSGIMSAASASLEVGRVGREISQAGATGPSFVKLTQSLDKLERAMQPFREAFTNLLNNGTSALLNVVTPLLNAMKPVIPLIEFAGTAIEDLSVAFRAWFEGKTQDQIRAEDMAGDAAAEHVRNMRAQQNFSDLIALRVNMGMAAGNNRPNPMIPARPIKGHGRQRRALAVLQANAPAIGAQVGLMIRLK